MMLPRKKRTQVVGAAFGIQVLVIGFMFGYGVFFTALEQELGWSRTLLSAGSSLAFLVMGMLAFVAGGLNDRYGPRWVMSITGLMTGLGYILMSQMQAPWQLLVAFGLFIGLGLSTHDVVTLSTVASWYDKRRGLITGVVKTGAATGQMLIPLLVTVLIAWLGWRQAMLVSGILSGIGLFLLSQLMERPHSTRSSTGVDVGGVSVREATRTRTLWTLSAIQFCFFPALMSIPVHIVAHSTDLGMTIERGATVLALIGGCSIAGRLAVGLLIDTLGSKRSLQFCLLPLLLSLVALLLIKTPEYLYYIAPVYGFAHGGLFTVVSPTVAEYFGMRAHGAIFGVILFFGTLGGAAGPLVVGMIFDRYDQYDLAFIILSVLVLTGLILATTLQPASQQK